MPDEDLLLDFPNSEFGSGIVGPCDICHKRQAVIILEKERYKLCVLDFLNKSWIRSEEEPTAETRPFTSFTEFVSTPAVPGGVALSIRLKPTRMTKHPLVMVMPDPMGLTTQTIEAAVRFARAGYEVVMPDAGRIQGIGFVLGAAIDRGMRVFNGTVYVPSAKRHTLFKVLDACRRAALEDAMVDGSRQALFGASYGGAMALAYAAETEGLKAVALAYPYSISPSGTLASLGVPVRAVYGDQDPTAGPSCDALNHARDRWGIPLEVAIVNGGGHNFLSRVQKGYDPKPAEEGWKAILGFLKASLDPSPAVPRPQVPPTLQAVARAVPATGT